MRKIIILFIVFLLSRTATYAAPIDTTYNKFLGTWRWVSGDDTLEIVLQQQAFTTPTTTHTDDVIVGWHRYVKDGREQQSSFQYIGRDVHIDFDSTAIDLKITMMGLVYHSEPNRAFFFTFWDLTLHKNFNLFLTYIPGTPVQLACELKEPRGIYIGPPGLNGVFTLPKDIVLTKQ